MTGRERVMRAVAHEKTDRVPMDYCTRDDVALKLMEHLGLPDRESLYRKLGIDARRFVVPDALGKREKLGDGSFRSGWGVVQRPSSDGLYVEWLRGPFSENPDLDRFAWPGLDCVESVESIERTIAPYKGEYATIATLNYPFKVCWHMRGMENFLCDTLADEDYAIALWKKAAEYELEKALRFVKAGGDIVSFSGDIAMQDRMMVSVGAWRRIDKPIFADMIRKIRELNGEVLIYYHSDGDMEAVLPDLIEIGVNIINPIQPECMDVARIKRQYGARFTLHGTISIQKTLPFGTPADVRREVLDRMALAAEDGGMILAPANHVQNDTPLENVLEIYRTAGSFQND